MSRECKRVPLDFEWPLNEVWRGYIDPYAGQSRRCDICDGTGYNAATKQLYDAWYSFGRARWVYVTPERHYNAAAWSHNLDADDVAALVAAGRLYDLTHVWIAGQGWVEKTPGYVPAPAEANAWSLRGLGHDSINCQVCVKAKAERLGVFGDCPACDGEGTIWPSPEVKAASEAWEPTEPPSGDGYQMWETTSEGSPISPVFATPEDLAQWLTGTGASAFGGQTASYQGWLRVCQGGYAPSAVIDADGMRPGVDL